MSILKQKPVQNHLDSTIGGKQKFRRGQIHQGLERRHLDHNLNEELRKLTPDQLRAVAAPTTKHLQERDNWGPARTGAVKGALPNPKAKQDARYNPNA